MKTRYVKALPENAFRINKLLKEGYFLYTVQKGIGENPLMLIFRKEENK